MISSKLSQLFKEKMLVSVSVYHPGGCTNVYSIQKIAVNEKNQPGMQSLAVEGSMDCC